MRNSAEPSAPDAAPVLRQGVRALLVGVVGLATALLIAVGPVNPLAALAPVGVVLVLWLLVRAPLAATTSVLLALMLAVDDTAETFGQWRTPLAILGDALRDRLDAVLGVPGLAFTGMELAAVAIFLIWLHREVTGSTRDGRKVPVASVLRDFLLLYLLGVLVAEAVGLARGLGAVPWKLRNLLHPILLVMLFLVSYRGPQDNRLIGRVIVFAACVRSVLAIVVQQMQISLTGGPWAHATSHGDSVLFAVAAFILVVDVLETPERPRVVRTLLLLPLIVAGMVENDRRLVWVMIALMLGIAYVLTPMRGWKRAVSRVAMIAAPIVAIYAAVGWNSQSRIFAPLRTFRSVSDTSMDRSAYWREVEIWNIAESIRAHPLVGTGLGGEYTEYMQNDDVSQFFKEYREWPHNSVLGLLLLMGILPFTATWLLLPLAIFLGVRSYRAATRSDDRTAALACIGAAVACLVLAYGDTGAHFPQYKIFAALAVAVSARLAVATGGWPGPRAVPEG
jgi:hypothetical protein